MKTCTCCGQCKPFDDFSKQHASPDGRQYTCKTCARTALRAWRAARPEMYLASKQRLNERKRLARGTLAVRPPDETGRTCSTCNEFKPWDDFHSSVGGTNDHSSRCKPCQLEAVKLSRRKNSESRNRVPEREAAD